jgi:hypothetical protein
MWFCGVGALAIAVALWLGSGTHPWRGWRHDSVNALECLAIACLVGAVVTGPVAIASLIRGRRLNKAEPAPQITAEQPDPAQWLLRVSETPGTA